MTLFDLFVFFGSLAGFASLAILVWQVFTN